MCLADMNREDPDTWIATTFSTGRTRPEQFRIGCPERPLPGMSCIKFENPYAKGCYDFWFLLILKPFDSERAHMSYVVPTDTGGLYLIREDLFIREVVSRQCMTTITASHGHWGPVRISRLKVAAYYRQIRSTLSQKQVEIRHYEPINGKLALASQPRKITGESFPPFPQVPVPSLDACLGRLDLRQADPVGTIYFPKADVQPDGDILLDGGEEYLPAQRGEECGIMTETGRLRAPGYYMDFSHQTHPFLSVSIFSMEPGGAAIVEYCREFRYDEFRTWVFKKKKRSWFRKKTTLKQVREELHCKERQCFVL